MKLSILNESKTAIDIEGVLIEPEEKEIIETDKSPKQFFSGEIVSLIMDRSLIINRLE